MQNILPELQQGFISFIEEAISCKTFSVDAFVEKMDQNFFQSGFREERNKNEILKILIIRLDEIGDNILSSGFLRELRANYPAAYITLVVNPVVMPLVELCPYVNAVRSFKGSMRGDFLENYQIALKFAKEHLWEEKYDICLCPRWDFDRYFATFLAYMSGARTRIGYSEHVYKGKASMNRGFDRLLTKAVINPEQIIHEAERNYYLLEAAGLAVHNKSMEIWYDKQDAAFARRLIEPYRQYRKCIAVAIGANEPNKKYPKELFMAAMQLLLKQEELCFILLGGRQEREESLWVAKQLPEKNCLNLTGETTLRQSAAILADCHLYIGNDTGLKHMAAALHLPVIEINREAESHPASIISLYARFFPWETPAISLRPQQAAGHCGEYISQGGCVERVPHCITQVLPQEIVNAYESLKAVQIKR